MGGPERLRSHEAPSNAGTNTSAEQLVVRVHHAEHYRGHYPVVECQRMIPVDHEDFQLLIEVAGCDGFEEAHGHAAAQHKHTRGHHQSLFLILRLQNKLCLARQRHLKCLL